MAKPDITGERLLALFLLGVLAFSPPLLSIFDNDADVAGLPALFLYLFGAWATLIVLMALTITRGTIDEYKVGAGEASNESLASPRGPGE